MLPTHDHTTLLYYSQVLRARIAIRDHYSNWILREIYENSGQLLSLVRLQLLTLREKAPRELQDELTAPGEIIGEVIRKWKEMGRNLNPEEELVSESGIARALQLELHGDKASVNNQVISTGTPFALSGDDGMIYFHAVLDLTRLIILMYGNEALTINIYYGDVTLSIFLQYLRKTSSGEELYSVQDEDMRIKKLELEERIGLINGDVKIFKKDNGIGKIKISMPVRA